MQWLICWFLLAGPPADTADLAAESAVGRINTVWVVPAERYAWVDPMTVQLVPGGRRFLVLANGRMRDLHQSCADAVAYLEAHADSFPGFAEGWRQHDMWFRIGSEDQPRGGPSAGVAFAVAAYSAQAGIPIRRDFAVTGEIVAKDGAVLGVGGVEDKIEAVDRAGIATFCVPADGAPDWTKFSLTLAQRLRVVTIETVRDAMFEAYGYDGPEAERYDRIMTLWRRGRDAAARRNAVAARLAFDELVDLAPGDLSARRLQSMYGAVDMRAAAENLFADAAQLERDGLPDLALRSARRAWGYADEPLRARFGEMLRRLEMAALDPAAGALLQQAEAQVARQQVGEAWRLLQRARLLAPEHPFIKLYAQAWEPFAAVAQLESTLAGNPTDTATRIALARALLTAKAHAAAAEQFGRLRELEPDTPRWLDEQIQALLEGRAIPDACDVLRGVRDTRPDDVARLCEKHDLELDPPSLEVTPPAGDGPLKTSLVRTVDAAGTPELNAYLDGTMLVGLRASPATLSLDVGLLAPGEHTVRLTSRDKFGNQADWQTAINVPAPAEPACLRELPTPGPAGGEVVLRAGGVTVVPAGVTLVFDAARLFGDALKPLRSFTVGDDSIGRPPWRMTVPTADLPPGRQTVAVVAGLADGEDLTGEVTVEILEQPTVWVAQPATGAALTGTVPVVVGRRGELAADAVSLLVDGWPHLAALPGQPLLLNPDTLPPGDHLLQAEVLLPDGAAYLTPPVIVRLGDPPAVETGPLPPLRGTSLAGLVGGEPTATAGVVSGPASPVLRLVSALPAGEPGAAPAPETVALRLEGGPLPGRLVLAVGDALAFDDAPAAEQLGEVQLVGGPLATTAWRLDRPGTWTLPVGEGIIVEVAASPALAIAAPASGTRLNLPTRLRLTVADGLGFETVALLAGDAPLGRWRVPLPDVWVEPLLLPAGDHVLRLVGTAADGAIHVSPPVLIRVD